MSDLQQLIQSYINSRPSFWPLVLGLISAICLYYVTVYSTRLKNRDAQKSKKNPENDKLVVSLFANETVLRDGDYSLIKENVKLFLAICSSTKLYLIVKIPEESATSTVLSSLESSGAFESGLARHRVMFCQSSNGRVSMVQQLQPDLHVELNSEDVELINSRVSRQNVTTFENMESILNTQVDKCVKN